MSERRGTLRVHRSITDVPEADWDALDGARSTPFTRWAFLEALEHAGCAAPRAGWDPRHLTVWRDGKLLAAAPAYIKRDSEADFSRDWGFADFAMRSGVRYYPKLVITVPITPVTGRRILVAPGEDRAAMVASIVEGARALAHEERLASIHVLFPDAEEARVLEAAGLARRVGMQGHWRNRGYADVGAWLASLRSKTRYLARKERSLPAAQGITIRTVRGPELAAERIQWGRTVGELYMATINKLMWGRSWLNPAFFARIFERMPERLEVVAAYRGGRVVAGAFNASSDSHLYGRYWGCHEEHPGLHFNVCLYHSIEDCIGRGLSVFEGGAGGEHKLHRGFDLAATHSAHAFMDPRLDGAIREYLVVETNAREAELGT